MEAVTFDLENLEVKGSSVSLFDNLRTEDTGAAQFSFSSDGTLAMVKGEHQRRGDFVWLDRNGRRESLRLSRRNYGEFKLSPDERYLALTVYDGWENSLLVRYLQTGVEQNLISEGENWSQVWSLDGQALAYNHYAPFPTLSETWIQPIDGSWGPLKLATGFNPGFFLAEDELMVWNPEEIAAVHFEESAAPPRGGENKRLKAGSYVFPGLSPDGNWLVYTDAGTAEEESQRWEIYVSPWPNLAWRCQISVGGGEEPRWNRNGKEIIYRSVRESIPKPVTDRWGTQWLSVKVEFEPEFKASSPEVLFEGPYINVPGYSWDISNDGERFLLIENVEHQSEPVTELVIVSNFFDLLREKVPTNN